MLIFFLCFLPGNEIPDLKVPFIDKWVHFVLFGAFAFFWCLAFPTRNRGRLIFIFLAGCLLGWLVEVVQGQLPATFKRSQDNMDTLADGIGAGLGVVVFAVIAAAIARGKNRPSMEGD